MALVPDICVGIKTNCSILVVKDTTDSYNADTNTGGWGAPNATTNIIDEAYINITYPDGLGTSTIVLSALPATVSGTFTLAEISIPPVDGEYTIEYVLITDARVEYSKKIKIFSSCVVRCCIDKMWSKYAGDDCDCGCSTEKTALQAEALYRAMNSSTACLNSNTRNKLLKKIQRLCELEDCNCK